VDSAFFCACCFTLTSLLFNYWWRWSSIRIGAPLPLTISRCEIATGRDLQSLRSLQTRYCQAFKQIGLCIFAQVPGPGRHRTPQPAMDGGPIPANEVPLGPWLQFLTSNTKPIPQLWLYLPDRNQRFHTIPQRLIKRPKRHR